MATPAQIASYLTAVNAFSSLFPEQAQTLQLPSSPSLIATLFNRHNFSPIGHVTASALVLDDDFNVCLLHHRSLGRLLQPGGHVEANQTLISAAMEETREETGISNFTVHPWCVLPGGAGYRPLNIDQHSVPENTRRGQPAHNHTDFLFLFQTPGVKPPLAYLPHESDSIDWFGLDVAAKETQHLAWSIQRLLSL